MYNYIWTTEKLFTINLPTEADYVVTAYYGVEGSTQDGKTTASLTGNAASFSIIEDQPDYIPYDQLTNDIVIGWIKNQLGKNGVLSIENAIAGMIDSQLNPPPTPKETPLPFSTK